MSLTWFYSICRLQFTPTFDSESAALFNGALLDLSSDDISDIDPIIDIIPEPVSVPLPSGFVPIVTAPSNTNSVEPLAQSTVLVQANQSPPYSLSDISDCVNPTASSTNTDTEYDFEPHQKHLQTLKVG